MATRETIQIGDPRLKKKNKTVSKVKSPEVIDLIKDLKDTMHENELIGIAAPQIGENYKIFVTEPRETETRTADQSDDFRVYINPEIVSSSEDEITIYEGCGSVLNGKLFGPVSRPRWIIIRAMDMDGKNFEFKADGILGRVIQHEYDHMLGIEFTEKIEDYRKLMSYEHYIEQIKSQDWHKDNSKITIKDYKKV
jgi:peptide deformylase